MLKDIGIEFKELIIIHCDNTSTMCMPKNQVLHSKTNHIYIKYHFLREDIEKKEIILAYVSRKEKITDIITKPLAKDTFEYLTGMLGVIPQPTST